MTLTFKFSVIFHNPYQRSLVHLRTPCSVAADWSGRPLPPPCPTCPAPGSSAVAPSAGEVGTSGAPGGRGSAGHRTENTQSGFIPHMIKFCCCICCLKVPFLLAFFVPYLGRDAIFRDCFIPPKR